MAFNLPTNLSTVEAWAGALYGYSIGSTTMAQVNADIVSYGGLNNTLNAYYSAAFASQTTATVAKTIVANVGLGTDANAIAYVTGQLNAATPATRGVAVANILNAFAALTADATYGAAATAWNTTVSNSVTYASANTADVTTVAAATAASAAASAAAAAAAAGKVYNLTTSVDTFTGTGNPDTFNADNTAGGGKYTLTAADTINGSGGNDTLKVYLAANDTATGAVWTNITNVPNVYVYAKGDGAYSEDFSTSTLTSLTIDSSDNATAPAVTTKGGPAITLANTAKGVAVTDTTATAQTINLSAVTASVINTSAATKETSLTIGSSSATSNVVTTLTLPAATTALTLTGATKLTLSAVSSTTLKSVDASATTGGVLLTDTGAPTTFTFVGGAGADTLTIPDANFVLLNSGSQLDGGAGSNTLNIDVHGANFAVATADYTAINAAKNFGTIQFTQDNHTLTVDASKITASSVIALNNTAAGAATISGLKDGATVNVLASEAAVTQTLNAGIGAHTINVGLGTSSLAADTDFGTIAASTFSTINLNSVTKTTNVNTVALTIADNTSIVVTGNASTVLTVTAATTVGDAVDFSANTGTFTYTASGKGDIIKAGSGTTTINGAAAFDTITLLAGHTKVDTINSLTTQYSTSSSTVDKISNFVLGTDTLKNTIYALAAGTELGASTATASKGIINQATYSTASAFATAAIAATGAAGDAVAWVDGSGNTWVAEWKDNTAGHVHIVELVGVAASSLSTTAGTAGAVIIG